MSEPTDVAVVVRPAYRQFYLRRGDTGWRSDEISEEGYAQGLEAISGFVYVGTSMYGSPTEVRARVHLREPAQPASADRTAEVVVEGSGDLAVLHWEPGEPPAAEVPLPIGTVRLRVSWFGTSEAMAHPDYEVGGEAPAPEHIVLDLWPV